MELLKVGVAALNQIPLDWEGNARRISEVLEEARREQISFLCLPELAVTGYGCEDSFLSSGVQQTSHHFLQSLLPFTEGICTGLGVPLLVGKELFNAVCVVADGEVLGFALKHFLPRDGVHYEGRWFSPWRLGRREEIRFLGKTVPIGDYVWDIGGVKIGFEICEDAWVENRPAQYLAELEVDIIYNPSASHFAFGKQELRKGFVLEACKNYGAAYLYANLLGNEAGRIVYDGASLIASKGCILASGKRFSFKEYLLTSAIIDLEAERKYRKKYTKSSQSYYSLVRSDEKIVRVQADEGVAACEEPAWENAVHRKEHEFTRAVSLGLFDYLRKSSATGFVVSLSGGADSGATAALVASMCRLAICELGIEEFRKAFAYIGGLADVNDTAGVVKELLCCVYQATENSSIQTRKAASNLVKDLGATFYDVNIQGIVDSYCAHVEKSLGIELSWKEQDLPLQNIQARARGPLAWMIANVKGALLLATSNRSEAAVGYTTMDGDTCGGLSPIGGIDKAFLRKWLVWFAEGNVSEIGVIPSLRAIASAEPTAELRPNELGQTDEADLMPYAVLDAIERCAIRDKCMPQEVLDTIVREFPEYEDSCLHSWVRRFFQLWSRNQWKRERYAPSFHLDDENLDPKTWCRFPILSGSFAWELSNLKLSGSKSSEIQ